MPLLENTSFQSTKSNRLHAALRACILLLASSSLITWASAASADSTFLLQLGSYSTEAQAQQQWDSLKAKNTDVLTNLNLHIAEVALPPDNTISYRTQAGPIASHNQAASLCTTLKSRGAQCSVVETALFTANAAPATIPAAPVVNPSVAVQPPTPTLNIPPAPPVSADLSTPPPPPPMPLPTPEPLPVPADSGIAANTPQAQPAHPTFWHRLFHGNGSSTQPALISDTASVPPTPIPVAPAVPAPVLTVSAAAPVIAAPPAAPPPPPPPIPVAAAAAVLTPPAPAPAPPPPPPLPIPVAAAAPVPAQPTPAPAPASVKVAANPNAVGEVNVAEAIRVPLSNGHEHKPIVVMQLPAVHGLGGSPSAITQKTYWAQLSYFADESQARGFFDDFSGSYPQLTDGVRVRITRPYSASSSAGHVSLRVGPFAGMGEINTICTAATSQGLHCTAVRDIGMSAAQNVPRNRVDYHGNFEDRTLTTPYAATSDERPMMYWVQLGSFRSPDVAWDTWNSLKQDQSKLLKHVSATVTTPAMSSSPRPLFRLRAGPFVNEDSANKLCDTLEGIGASNCIVVNDK